MKADSKAADAALPAVGMSKKKLLMLFAGAVLAVGGASGGAAWYFTQVKAEVGPHGKPKLGPPVFVPLEPFTVNLQPENGEQFLQVSMTLQVVGTEQKALIDDNLPKVRSRILLLLSGKKASEVNTVEGKKELSKEIVEQLRRPFDVKGPPQDISDVLFTAFIIQ